MGKRRWRCSDGQANAASNGKLLLPLCVNYTTPFRRVSDRPHATNSHSLNARNQSIGGVEAAEIQDAADTAVCGVVDRR